MWYVWVFLAPLCPICQDYTYYLNALNEQWEEEYPEQLEMVGWFPNPTVTDEQIARFSERYSVEWPLAKDTLGWSDAVDAKWTPEAFLIDPEGQVRYRGRVNDLYYALGKHRTIPKRQDLAMAVEQA
ncbi:MAG: redoxin domain-containing protein, partial [Flavobacteriales bacterium]|nr:redoxin domain-containing protein [Flavobacteriales bacterium]